MKLENIHTDEAPKAIGPYSQAVRLDKLLYTSGQIPLDPKTGELVKGEIEVQTERVLNNLEAILKTAGTGFDRVVMANVYLTDLSLFGRFNEVYARRFSGHKPARVTVGVAALPKGAMVEIGFIAALA